MLAGSIKRSTGVSVRSGLDLVIVKAAVKGGSMRAGVLAPEADADADAAATPPKARNISSSVYTSMDEFVSLANV